MGQTIQINRVTTLGRVLIIDADRSLTGQDGEAFTGRQTASHVDSIAAQLAVRLFESDTEVDYIHVMSNAVSVRRRADWSNSAADAAAAVVAEFFRVYPD
jgi:hypothetical protein